jgi:thiazole synthase
MSDNFQLAGTTFNSRLIIGTGKYRSYDEMKAAHKASGAEMVTVAVNRVPLDGSSESFLDHLDPQMKILPNTAGCYDAEHAIRTARLAREALNTDWIKLEVIGDPVTLLPDNEQTLAAAKVLVGEGFIVLPYFTDDLIMAKKLLAAGCPAVMPLAAPIGSGMGVQNPSNLRIMREQLPDAIIIVDAGVGRNSDEYRDRRSRRCGSNGDRDEASRSGRPPRVSRGPNAQTPLCLGIEPDRRCNKIAGDTAVWEYAAL